MSHPLDLVIVVPVFNEEDSVGTVVREWMPVLESLGMEFRFLLLDDGSTDRTPEILQELSRENPGRMEIVRHSNRGHGQTVLEGYRRAAAANAVRVFQMDSDGQCDSAFFPEVWALRDTCDVVYGRRTDRRDGWRRKLASVVLKAVVFLSAGVVCADANSPYRLMRVDGLRAIVERIPQDFDLANIALAVLLKRSGWTHGMVNIRFRERFGGEPTVPLSRFASKALDLAKGLRGLKVKAEKLKG
ncbi:MAG TPA: glycosyltransferase family 2 protein [Terrimicrobiaceae bacterium]|nr:glycosyltransferase family 2 protein [Terrimicrobiaceae bacterium]